MSGVIKFSIPYNGDLDLVEWAIASGQVYEVYFSGSAETDYKSNYNDYDQNKIKSLVRLCAEKKVGRNFLMNKSILFFNNMKNIFTNLKRMDSFGGLTAVTVGDKLIVPYIRRIFPKITIQSSVFLHIDSASKVREALKMGITGFCLDVSCNRNGPELEKIRDLKKYYPEMTVKLFANHGCYNHCFYALQHQDWFVLEKLELKNAVDQGENILGNMIKGKRCMYRTNDLADEIRRPFIRPEDISFYEENNLADYIKIANRVNSTPLLQRILNAYFNRAYRGDIFTLILGIRGQSQVFFQNASFPKGFVRKVCFCGQDCDHCVYCRQVALRTIEKRRVV